MKKVIYLLLVAVFLISALPVAAETEITWWAFPVFTKVDEELGKYEQMIIDAFEAANPDIKVKVEMIDFQAGPEKIATAIEGNTTPDVLFDAPGRILVYAKAGKMAPLTDMFTDEYKADIASEAFLSSCGDGKDYYMYPISGAPFVMAYNKGILEEEGLMDMVNLEGDRTWTTDQFTALNAALAEKGYENAIVFCRNQGGDQGTRAFISNLYSSWPTNREVTAWTMNDEAGVKGLEYAVEQIKAGNLVDGITYNGGEAIDEFVYGKVSSLLLWGPGLAKIKAEDLEATGVEALALPFPSDDGIPELEYLVNGFGIFDNGDPAKIEAAKKFIRFIADDPEWGPKNVISTGVFPVRKSFGNLYEGDAEMEFYGSLSKYYGPYYNTIDGYGIARPEWWAALQAATTGEKTAKEALDHFVEVGNAAYAEAQADK